MNKFEVSKEKFESYVDVQMSGVTNMFDVRTVQELSGLDRNEIMYIMKHYSEMQKEYDV